VTVSNKRLTLEDVKSGREKEIKLKIGGHLKLKREYLKKKRKYLSGKKN